MGVRVCGVVAEKAGRTAQLQVGGDAVQSVTDASQVGDVCLN